MTAGDATRRIAAFAAAFDPASLTEAERETVARTLLDTHAVAAAGVGEPAAVRVRNHLAATGLPPGGATLWGSAVRTGPEAAALANAVAAHILDYDDVSAPMRGHPSVVLWPALVALAEHRDLAGARLAAAYVVGFEVIVKVSRAMALRHYALGWHATPTLGLLGAAVACAHLIGLDERQTANALGLAIAQAAGTQRNFGSDAKSFQAGHAASAAVRSALLAEAGLDAGLGALDGPGGFVELCGGNLADLPPHVAALGAAPREILASGVEVKKYPMCYAAHRPLDGLLDLRAEHGLSLARVAAVEVRSSREGLVPLIHHRPVTGLQAKFSLEYAVAAALADGAVRLASFDDAQVCREAVQAFFARVTGREEGKSLFPRWVALRLTLDDGRVLERRVEKLRGSADLPVREPELLDKARECHERAGRPIDVAAFLGAARAMHRGTARELMAASEPR